MTSFRVVSNCISRTHSNLQTQNQRYNFVSIEQFLSPYPLWHRSILFLFLGENLFNLKSLIWSHLKKKVGKKLCKTCIHTFYIALKEKSSSIHITTYYTSRTSRIKTICIKKKQNLTDARLDCNNVFCIDEQTNSRWTKLECNWRIITKSLNISNI